MPGTHAKLSPSAGRRWMNCPGSVRLSEGIESGSSSYAQEGTAAHFLAEWCLNVSCRTNELESILEQADRYQEVLAEYEHHTRWVDDEMRGHVQAYVDLIRKDMNAIPTGERIFAVEEKFDLGWLAEDIFGTNDAMLGAPLGLLRIYDLKYGAGIPVEAIHNTQAMIYALGAIGKDNPNNYFDVEIVIFQPRCPHPEGPERRWTISVADLMEWAHSELLPTVRAIQKPDAPLKVGEWCHFCPALGACPQMSKQAYDLAQVQFKAAPETINLPAPELLSKTDIAKVLQFSEMISAWAKEVAGYAQSILEAGGSIDGYKLVARKSNRAWIDVEKAAAYMEPTLGNKIYTKPKLKSPAQIEKLIGKDRKDWIRHLWQKPDAGVTIAPMSDRRRAVAPSAVKDFLTA